MHFTKPPLVWGWDAVWLDSTEYNANTLQNTDGFLFLVEGSQDNFIPINTKAFYILHNCEKSKYSVIEENHKLVLQVFTNDVFTRDIIRVKNNLYEYWQKSENTLYMPWATDILPNEIDENIKNVKAGLIPKQHNRALFLGTIWDGIHGNINEIKKFFIGCQQINLPFEVIRTTTMNQNESIEQHQRAIMTPTIVGTWQKEKGYIPCRIFKTISYGQLGVTNSKTAYEVVNKYGIYTEHENELPNMAMEKINDVSLRIDAMRYVRDNHTYINRIESIQYIFQQKNEIN